MRARNATEAEMNELFDYTMEYSGKLFAAAEHRDAVGAFEGANYEAIGYYRSEQNCIMFTRISDFCRVYQGAISQVIDEYSLAND